MSESAYDPFAWVYNRYWGTQSADRLLPALDELLLQDLPSGAHVLDLCCGTGQRADTLTQRGFRVTGVDNSEEMLRFARQNAPAAAFIRADARSFETKGRY